MACSCKLKATTAQVAPTEGGAAGQELPHEVLPGESCIFCALKHLSTAWTALLSGDDIGMVIGDLELARRHTKSEYSEQCRLISLALYDAVTAGKELAPRLETALRSVEDIAAHSQDGATGSYTQQEPAAGNPLVGLIHLCAAYRLATELGYMMPNKAMLIGDLDLASEHFARYGYDMSNELRERRHIIQRSRASDITIYWPHVCRKALQNIRKELPRLVGEHRAGLAAWLGIAATE